MDLTQAAAVPGRWVCPEAQSPHLPHQLQLGWLGRPQATSTRATPAEGEGRQEFSIGEDRGGLNGQFLLMPFGWLYLNCLQLLFCLWEEYGVCVWFDSPWVYDIWAQRMGWTVTLRGLPSSLGHSRMSKASTCTPEVGRQLCHLLQTGKMRLFVIQCQNNYSLIISYFSLQFHPQLQLNM